MQTRQRTKASSYKGDSTPISCPRIERISAKKYSTVNAKSPKDHNFDKYYILPSLRYKRKN